MSTSGRTLLLLGPAGSGKTTMAVKTAPRRPVHIIDIDQKVPAMANLSPEIASGDVTFSKFNEPLTKENLAARARQLAENRKPQQKPVGWEKIAELIDGLPRNEDSRKAGTWVLDSLTIALDHLVQLILYSSPKGTGRMSVPEWGVYLQMCKETITNLRDLAKFHEKDLIVIVHERLTEIPKDGTRMFYDGSDERKIIGDVAWKWIPSIPGQFGDKIATYFEEVYALKVKEVGGKPVWTVRVHPDGVRDLRCSYNVKASEFSPPSLTEIWGK